MKGVFRPHSDSTAGTRVVLSLSLVSRVISGPTVGVFVKEVVVNRERSLHHLPPLHGGFHRCHDVGLGDISRISGGTECRMKKG
jgi:hypothetical protein